MDEKQDRKIMMQILAESVCEKTADSLVREDITPELMTSVYHLAKAHDFAHIVAEYVIKKKIEVSPELESALKRDALLSVYRCEQLNYTLKEICRTFDAANIPYIPLKGSVIRPYYPKASMRTSCDIDILIHEDDLLSAVSILEEKGYLCGERKYHDISLYSPNQIHLELHFSIQENIESLDRVLKDAWAYAVPAEESRYEFSKAFFAFHMYAHMAYHFLAGGCGLRALMDIWIMEHNMDIHYSCAEKLLREAGILQFAAEMSDIANQYFSTEAPDGFAEQVLQYIYYGGVYGSKANNIAVYRTKGSNTLCYMIERIFPPYRTMAIIFPVLKKKPFWLPICWIVRWVKALFQGKTTRLVAEVACANNISEDKVAQTKAICNRLGL